jgi:hypothetical protein
LIAALKVGRIPEIVSGAVGVRLVKASMREMLKLLFFFKLKETEDVDLKNRKVIFEG